MNAYNIAWWGAKYYDINDKGHVIVRPNPDNKDAVIDLASF